MSINDFLNKIKGEMDIDRTTLLCLLVIILVGLGSFGLGRLSLEGKQEKDDIKLEYKNLPVVKGEIGKSEESKINEIDNNIFTKEKMYVASKNGKLYYSTTCSGAKRIKPENELWFSTSSEAEDSGFTLSKSCK